MVVKEMKCGMCGHRFEAELLDRDNPRERHAPGAPLRFPSAARPATRATAATRSAASVPN